MQKQPQHCRLLTRPTRFATRCFDSSESSVKETTSWKFNFLNRNRCWTVCRWLATCVTRYKNRWTKSNPKLHLPRAFTFFFTFRWCLKRNTAAFLSVLLATRWLVRPLASILCVDKQEKRNLQTRILFGTVPSIRYGRTHLILAWTIKL